MTHHQSQAAVSRELRIGRNAPGGGASLRMVAAMSEDSRPDGLRALPGEAAPSWTPGPYEMRRIESDAAYFRRRSGEERRAADEAAGAEARKAHLALAELHAERSAPRRLHQPGRTAVPPAIGHVAHASRGSAVDARLDAALEGTFPASDPVSVAFIR